MGTIELAGKPYELRFTAYSLYRLQKETGHDIGYFIGQSGGGSLPYALANIIFAGLASGNQTLTIEQIAKRLPLGSKMSDLIALGDKVMSAFNESMGYESMGYESQSTEDESSEGQ